MKFMCRILILVLLFALFIVPAALADNSCINCHEKLSAFNETEKEFNKIRLKHLARDVVCSLECHATTIDKIVKSNYEQWTKSKHAMFNVTCNNCHGGNPASDLKETAHAGVARSSDSGSSVFYRNVPETCGKCHTKELDNFKNSLHYQKLKALEAAPTCDTCHRPHEFKVLNLSEFQDLCSNCHNPERGIAPDAPEKAKNALTDAEKLKQEIIKADNAIKQAKQEGKDTSAAQDELDKAVSSLDSLPVIWHGFNMPSFEGIIADGFKAARKAQQLAGVPAAEPSTPGFEIILTLTGIIAIYLLRRR